MNIETYRDSEKENYFRNVKKLYDYFYSKSKLEIKEWIFI